MTLSSTSVLKEAGAPVSRLCFLHLFWIVLSNFAVQLPLTLTVSTELASIVPQARPMSPLPLTAAKTPPEVTALL